MPIPEHEETGPTIRQNALEEPMILIRAEWPDLSRPERVHYVAHRAGRVLSEWESIEPINDEVVDDKADKEK